MGPFTKTDQRFDDKDELNEWLSYPVFSWSFIFVLSGRGILIGWTSQYLYQDLHRQLKTRKTLYQNTSKNPNETIYSI